MADAAVARRWLALELAGTVRHDGSGGVADDLAEPGGLTRWVGERADLLGGAFDTPGFTADPRALAAVVSIRQAVRALLARAVRPAPPSPADAKRLIPVETALDRINTAVRRAPANPQLAWPDGGPPLLTAGAPDPSADPLAALTAALARSAVEFLTGPQREQLRACTAPRCVRYFLKEHGRQEFCKPSCSNRARAARHYQRHRPSGANPAPVTPADPAPGDRTPGNTAPGDPAPGNPASADRTPRDPAPGNSASANPAP